MYYVNVTFDKINQGHLMDGRVNVKFIPLIFAENIKIKSPG
jgi:hypothetical protein